MRDFPMRDELEVDLETLMEQEYGNAPNSQQPNPAEMQGRQVLRQENVLQTVCVDAICVNLRLRYNTDTYLYRARRCCSCRQAFLPVLV